MKSFPFDSEVTYTDTGEPLYDRASDSQELRAYFNLMFSNGVFPNPSTGLQVVAYTEAMSVAVLPGSVIIQGAFGLEENERVIVFEAAGTTYDRIDAVVARLNTNHDYRKIDLYVIKGVEATTPVAPELTREGGVYELRLANVFIAKNTSTIPAERITDTRLIAEDCGIAMCNPKQVDTTAIFNQYQAALAAFIAESEDWEETQQQVFNEWFEHIKDQLSEDAAGNLQNQIDKINTSRITAYADVMANTVAGYTPDALAVKEGFEQVNNKLTASDGTAFRFGYNADTGEYGYIITGEDGADTVIPFSNAKKLYEALQYSGLVTEDMTFDEMCAVLLATYPQKIYYSKNLTANCRSEGTQTTSQTGQLDCLIENVTISGNISVNAVGMWKECYLVACSANGTQITIATMGSYFYGSSSSAKTFNVSLPSGRYTIRLIATCNARDDDEYPVASANFVIKNY